MRHGVLGRIGGALYGGAVEAKSEDPRYVGLVGRKAGKSKCHEEKMRKRGSKEGTVDTVGGSRCPEDMAASRAIDDHLLDADAVV